MSTLQTLIQKGILVLDAEATRECELLAYWSIQEGYILIHQHQSVCNINQELDGDIWIITAQGEDHVGEYKYDPNDDLIDVDVYHKVDV